MPGACYQYPIIPSFDVLRIGPLHRTPAAIHILLASATPVPRVSTLKNTQPSLASTRPRRHHVSSLRFESMLMRCSLAIAAASPRRKSNPSCTDNHLLARGPTLPGRICARGHLPRRYRHWYPRQGWHCPRRRAQGHIQAPGARHLGGEALRPQRVCETSNGADTHQTESLTAL